MNSCLRYLVLVLLLSLSFPAYAEKMDALELSSSDIVTRATISLTDRDEVINLARIMQIHAHSDTPTDIADVFADDEKQRFSWLNDESLNSGFQTAPVYGYFVVENLSSKAEWYIRIHYALLDQIDLYQIDDFSDNPRPLRHVVTMGDSIPFESRAIKVPTFVHRLNLPIGQRTLLVVRIQTEGARYSDLYLHSADNLAEMEASRGLGLGLYFGALFVLALYNLLLFFYFRSTQYLVFCGLVVTIATLFLTESGLVAQHFVPDSPEGANLFFLLSLCGTTFMGFWLLLVFLYRSIGTLAKRLLS